MAVITLEEYKLLAGITGTTYDTLITALIPMVQSDIISICNYDFGEDTDYEDFPEGMKLYAAQMITYQRATAGNVPTKQSESIDGYSYTRAEIGASGYPASVESGLKSKWGHVSAKTTQPVSAFRDRRGQGVRSLSESGPSYSYPGVPV
jgi:hypothetical protein